MTLHVWKLPTRPYKLLSGSRILLAATLLSETDGSCKHTIRFAHLMRTKDNYTSRLAHALAHDFQLLLLLLRGQLLELKNLKRWNMLLRQDSASESFKCIVQKMQLHDNTQAGKRTRWPHRFVAYVVLHCLRELCRAYTKISGSYVGLPRQNFGKRRG